MNLLAWPLTVLALVFMFPWARWLLRRAGSVSDPVLTGLTTLGLSVGTLSLVLLWIGLIGLHIDWRLAAGVCAVIGGVGWLLPSPPAPLSTKAAERPRDILALAAVGLIGVIVVLILFNAAYWPFGIDDAVTIYATFGKQIAQTGQLPRGSLYELYPMLVPISYAFTHQAAGWIDEHLAALIPAILSVGLIGVAYLLGRELYNRTVGLIAALLIALTPQFTHWASSGYVDLPAGFFYGLAAFFILQLDAGWSNALLAGIMAGLSAWTKNSGLLIGLSIAAWVVYRAWLARRDPRRAITLKQVGLIAAGFVAVAGPWYVRNLSLSGALMPPTGWTWKAEPTLANLLPYIADNRYFVIGWLFTAGLAFTIWQVLRPLSGDDHPANPARFLLVFYLPFFVIWWVLFSYDGRFLLVLTPFIAVMGAHLVQAIVQRVRLPRSRIVRWAAILLVGLAALPAASAAVDFKAELLRRPFMSEADKHRLRLGADRYDMALALRTLPAGSRVWTQDLLLPYQADGVHMTVGGWPTASNLSGFDYWVLSPGETLPDWFGPATPERTQGGYRLYALHR